MTAYIEESKTLQGDGGTRTIYPVLIKEGAPYKMACCDCGLVHDIHFSVEEVVQRFADGSYETVEADGDYKVAMRVFRNNRSTGQMRRHQGVTVKKEY